MHLEKINLWPYVALAFLFACAAIAKSLLRGKADAKISYERTPILSAAERSFYGVLMQAVGNRWTVFAKVRLADILKPTGALSNSSRYSAFNRICSKHADFVLCENETMKVVAVVELDDASHGNERAKDRDGFVDGALSAVGIGVVRKTS